jgi:hypothetical protein
MKLSGKQFWQRTSSVPHRTRTNSGRTLSPLSLPLDYGLYLRATTRSISTNIAARSEPTVVRTGKLGALKNSW